MNTHGRSYELGSQGIVVSKGTSYNGFSLYVNEEGIAPFKYVKLRGYDHDDLSVTSVESETGTSYDRGVVNRVMKNHIKDVLGYDNIMTVSSLPPDS